MRLPTGWVLLHLKEIQKEGGGSVAPRMFSEEEFDLFSIPSFSNQSPEVVAGSGIGSSKQLVREGDILLSKIVPHIRRVWVVPKASGRRQIGSGEWIVYRSSHLEPHFIRLALSESSFRAKFLNTISGVGGSLMRANPKRVAEFYVPLPPLAEQKCIVAKMDALSAKSARARAELSRIETLVSRYKQTVLSKAFSGELTGGWRIGSHQSDLDSILKAVRSSRKYSPKLARRKPVGAVPRAILPETWRWISPDELASDEAYSIGIGPFGSNLVKEDYRASGVRLVFVRDIRREEFSLENAVFIDDAKADELHQHTVTGGDLLITKMGDPPGDTAIYPSEQPAAVITADCIKLRPNLELTLSKFLYWAIRSKPVREQILEETKGVAQQKLSLERFRQIAIPTPPLEEQYEIVRRIESAFSKIDRLAVQAKRAQKLLGKLDEAILTKAIRGELVPQDEANEPAEKLLERIRAERQAAPKVKSKRTMRVTNMPTARNFLNAKLENWPAGGVSFQDLKLEFGGRYDDLKEAVFASLADEQSPLKQIFDDETSTMVIRKRER